MKNIPKALIYSRLVTGAVILLLAIMQPPYCRPIIITLISLGLFSDIVDGIIARRMGISSEKMRRLDSTIDQVFWVLVIIGTCIISPAFYKEHLYQLLTIIILEFSTYGLSYIKFRKEVATHAILSKIWTLSMFATIIQAIAMGSTGILFTISFYLGFITRLEILLILIVLKHWTNDVPSLYHAVQIRAGKNIKRSKWFNG